MNEQPRWKLLLISTGKALCYLTLFLGWQVIVSTVYTLAIMMKLILAETVATGGAPVIDEVQMIEAVMARMGEITLVSGLLTLGSVALFFKLRKKPLRAELHLRPVPGRVLGWCAGMAFCLYWFVSLALGFLPAAWLEEYVQASGGIAQTEFMAVLSTALVAPVVEEVIFRGLILTRLERAMPGWAAVVLSAAIFGACHGQMVWFCYAFLLGLVFAWVARESGSLLPSILMHLTFNTTNEVLLLFVEWEPDLLATLILLVAATAGTALCAWRLSVCLPTAAAAQAPSVPAYPAEQAEVPPPAAAPEVPSLPGWDPDAGMGHRFPPQRF